MNIGRFRILGTPRPQILCKLWHGRSMKKDPIVFALANPTPEIDPFVAKKVRKDVILATGRSDFPNQVRTFASTEMAKG